VYQDGLGRSYKTVREGGLTQITLYLHTLTRPWKESLWHLAGGTARYIEYSYDSASRVRLVTNPDSSQAETQYGIGYRDVFDELGHERRIFSDGLGRTTQIRERNGSTYYYTSYSYDPIDRLIQSVDAENNQSNYTWWSWAGLKSYVCRPGTGCWNYIYNDYNQLVTQIDARGLSVTYTYDSLGRLKTKNVQSVGVYEWFYDEAGHGDGIGRVTRVTYPGTGNNISFAYDSMGRASSETRCVDSTCKTLESTYDQMDRVAGIEYPNSEVVNYNYDTSGRMKSVSGYVADMTWSPAGQLLSMTYTNGAETTYTYDADREWLQQAMVEDGSGSVAYNGVYTYDVAARVERMDVSRPSSSVEVWDYAYDPLDRLTTLIGGGGVPSELYTYDALGNLLIKGGQAAYQYGDANNPFAVTRVGPTRYQYDASGNRTEKGTCVPAQQCTTYTATEQYTFDADGRMTSFKDIAANETTSYRYAADSERIRVSGPDGTRRIFGAYVETLPSNDEVYFYYAGPIRVAMNDPDGTSWYHHDHLGSVRLMTDEEGDAVATADFMPFGSQWESTGSDGANPYDFAGHRTDAESGLVYMNARYYDPVMGRFISPDRVVPDILNPQSLNPYAYAYNNPISNTDPTGHAPVVAAVIGFISAVSAFLAPFAEGIMAIGGLVTIAGMATQNPTLMTIGGIMMGFGGAYGLHVGEFGLGLAGGLLGASASWLSSAHSPLSASARQIVGWAWTAVGAIRSISSSIQRQSSQVQQQLQKVAMDASQGPSSTAGAAAQGAGGILGAIAGGIAKGIGYLWNAPNTALGLVFGGIGHAVGEMGYALGLRATSPSIGIGNNAIQFLDNPFTPSGITIGNVTVYGPGVSPNGGNVHFSNTPAGFTVGMEEGLHTIQGMILGPLYLPLHVVGGVTSIFRVPHPGLLHKVDGWHQNNFMESGPMQGSVF
jgi:RHS repeat-associated protein